MEYEFFVSETGFRKHMEILLHAFFQKLNFMLNPWLKDHTSSRYGYVALTQLLSVVKLLKCHTPGRKSLRKRRPEQQSWQDVPGLVRVHYGKGLA